MEFSEAVNIIRRHLNGARGEIPEGTLNKALLRVLPSLEDISEEIKFANRSAAQIRRVARKMRA